MSSQTSLYSSSCTVTFVRSVTFLSQFMYRDSNMYRVHQMRIFSHGLIFEVKLFHSRLNLPLNTICTVPSEKLQHVGLRYYYGVKCDTCKKKYKSGWQCTFIYIINLFKCMCILSCLAFHVVHTCTHMLLIWFDYVVVVGRNTYLIRRIFGILRSPSCQSSNEMQFPADLASSAFKDPNISTYSFWSRICVLISEYKRARTELKKRSIETIRLQKKLRKGSSHNGGSFTGTLPRSGGSNGSDTGSLHGGNQLNRILEVALRDNADKRQAFEDAEKVVSKIVERNIFV